MLKEEISNKTISITLPALNEEANLKQTLEIVISATQQWKDVEIIVVDDGSSDNTSKVANLFKSKCDLRIIRNETSLGRGHSINEGFRKSKNEYVICFNGKRDTTRDEIKKILNQAGTEDLIISYQSNTNERPLVRQFFSHNYTFLVNSIFNKKIKYYNGSILLKKKDFMEIEIKTSSYAFETELILKLLHKNKSYKEVPVIDIFEKGRKTRALSLKNLLGVISTVARLFYELRLKNFRN